jgi:hypothetical protein
MHTVPVRSRRVDPETETPFEIGQRRPVIRRLFKYLPENFYGLIPFLALIK